MLVRDLVPLTERYDTFDLYQSITAAVQRAARTAQKDPLFARTRDDEIWYQDCLVANYIGRALHRLMAGVLKQHPIAGLKTCEVVVKPVDRGEHVSGMFDSDFASRKARLRLNVGDAILRQIWQDGSLAAAQEVAKWAAHELTHLIHDGPLSRIPGSDWPEIADAVRSGQRSGRGWRLFVDSKRFDPRDAANAIARRHVSGNTWRLQRSTDVLGMATRRIDPPAGTGDYEGDFQKDYLSRFGEIEAYASQTANELLTSTGGDRVQALRLMKAVIADGATGSETLTRYLTYLKGSKPLRLYLKKVADILSRRPVAETAAPPEATPAIDWDRVDAAEAQGYGGPLFHGTPGGGFDTIDLGRSNPNNEHGTAFYLSNSQSVAADYSRRGGRGVVKVYMLRGRIVDCDRKVTQKMIRGVANAMVANGADPGRTREHRDRALESLRRNSRYDLYGALNELGLALDNRMDGINEVLAHAGYVAWTYVEADQTRSYAVFDVSALRPLSDPIFTPTGAP